LGRISVPGYTPLMLVITFFGGLTALGLGIVGEYLWLTLQNGRQRPSYVIRSVAAFGPSCAGLAREDPEAVAPEVSSGSQPGTRRSP
jgi:hypothetical protein